MNTLIKNKQKHFLSLVLFAFFLLTQTTLQATHIVGGDMNYECLGNDQYKITLNVYRDCAPGNLEFDEIAHIGIYDDDGQLVDHLQLPFTEEVIVESNINDPCLIVLNPVCVSTTTYDTIVTLPFLEEGYTMAYQRCCRNHTLDNIVDPDITGATFLIELSGEAMMECNNSPVFTNWPPIYVCTDRELEFDHSATDLDGDSLVYRLCTPFAGATEDDPRPEPANPPPYDTVVYAGGYSLENVLGAGVPLVIDPETGIMTAIPGNTGQFVVGVCVEEYDSETGELLSVTKRDFQYNINPCGENNAAFFAPEVQCDDLEVSFENQSSDFASSFEWIFDYPVGSMTSSTMADTFSVLYPDTGTYVIQLIANPGTSCADTIQRSIYLQHNSLTADVDLSVYDCDDTSFLAAVDLSVDFVSPPIAWDWEIITIDGDTITSDVQNPVFDIPLDTEGTVTLTVTSENGCVDVFTDTFTTGGNNHADLYLQDFDTCVSDTAYLNPNAPIDAGYTYNWAPANLVSDTAAINPYVIINETTEFSVTVTPPAGDCEIVRTVTVTAIDLPELDFTTHLDCDGLTIEFTNTSEHATSYNWDFGDLTTTDDVSTEENPIYTYPDLGTYEVTLSTGDDAFCAGEVTQDVLIEAIELSAAFSTQYSECSTDSVVVQLFDESINTNNNTSAWTWTLTPSGTSTEQNPTFVFYESGTVNVSLTIETEDGCTNTMSSEIEVLFVENSDQFPDSLIVCNGGSAQLLPAGDTTYTYLWSPSEGIDDVTSPSPIFNPSETTTYSVEITAIGVDTCQHTEEVIVFVTPAINAQVTGDGATCEPSSTLVVTTDVATDIVWFDINMDQIATGNEYTVDPVSGLTTLTAIATDQYSCTDSLDIEVIGGPVDVSMPDTLAICEGDTINIVIDNLDTTDTLTYTWTPTSAFEDGTANFASPNYIETIGAQTVYVTIQNQFGCTYMDSINIAVIDDEVNLDFEQEVQCDGSTVEFTNTSTNAFGYTWNFGDGTTSNEENPTHSYNQPGTYTVTLSTVYSNIYDADCIVDQVQEVVVQDPDLIVGFTFDTPACSADSSTIAFFDQSMSNFPITAWNWTFSDGQSSNEQNPIITFQESGVVTVTLTVMTSNECESTLTQDINIEFVDIASTMDNMVVVCLGDDVVLNPGGNESYIYEWTPNINIDDTTIASPTVTPTETTTYYVTAYAVGTDTCFVMDSVVVFVPEDINVDLGDDIVTCGEDITLTANADVPLDSIIWTSAVDGIIPTNNGTIIVNPFRQDTIIVTVFDEYGCMDSDTVYLDDQGIDIEYDTPLAVCEEIETTLSIQNIDGLDVLDVTWLPTDYIIGDNTGTEIMVDLPLGEHTFTITIQNQHNCTDTIQMDVNVAVFDVDIADEIHVCPGIPEGIYPDANTDYSYIWSPATGLDDPTLPNPTFIGTETTTYTVTITDDSGLVPCETIEEITVIVDPEVGLQTTGDTTLCEIVPVELTATVAVTPNQIDWYEGNTDTPFANGSPITVTPMVGTNTYTAIATDNTTGCMDTSIVVVQVNPLEEGIPDAELNICPNVPTPINPDFNPNVVYEWSPTTYLDLTNPSNPIVTTNEDITYIVTITDPVGDCFLIDTVNVFAYDEINPTISTQDTTLCSFDPIELAATSDVSPATFSWYADAAHTDLIGSGTPITVTPNATTTYYLEVEDQNGCTEETSITIDAYPIQASLTPELVICEDVDFVELEVINAGPEEIINYVWSPAENIDGEGANVNGLVDLGINEFSVEVTNEFGCTETLNTTATIIDFDLTLDIEAIPDTILNGESSVISVLGSCIGCTYTWDIPSGEITPEDGPVITATPAVDESGDQVYTVTVDLLGCTTELEASIYVINAICDEDHIFVPNAFTPNGDDENDIFRIRSFFLDELTEVEFMIYNRWGEEVFRTKDPHQGWDGTFRDRELAPDVYGFYLRVVCPEGIEYIKKGNVTLLR